MENTLENKAKFFAQYFGQQVLSWVQLPNKLCSVSRLTLINEKLEESVLELKPISSSSIEDAEELGKFVGHAQRRTWNNSLY